MKTMIVKTRHSNSTTNVTSELAHYWYDEGLSINSFIVGVLDGTINAGYSIVSYAIIDTALEEGKMIVKSIPRGSDGQVIVGNDWVSNTNLV